MILRSWMSKGDCLLLTNLFFNVCRLIWRRSGKDAGVGEAGLEQGDDHKHKEASSNHRYAAGQVFDQEGAAVIVTNTDIFCNKYHLRFCTLAFLHSTLTITTISLR